MKNSYLRFRCEKSLKDKFIQAATESGQNYSEIFRQFMDEFIKAHTQLKNRATEEPNAPSIGS